jgi:hypothetical protein
MTNQANRGGNGEINIREMINQANRGFGFANCPVFANTKNNRGSEPARNKARSKPEAVGVVDTAEAAGAVGEAGLEESGICAVCMEPAYGLVGMPCCVNNKQEVCAACYIALESCPFCREERDPAPMP